MFYRARAHLICLRLTPTLPSPKIFFRRQSDSSWIVGCIIYPRPGLRALSIDPFVPCVIHWYTIYPPFHAVLFRPRVEGCSICFAMPQQIYKLVFLAPKILRNCYCELKLYIIPIEENQYKITSVQGNTGRFKETIKTTFHIQEVLKYYNTRPQVISSYIYIYNISYIIYILYDELMKL